MLATHHHVQLDGKWGEEASTLSCPRQKGEGSLVAYGMHMAPEAPARKPLRHDEGAARSRCPSQNCLEGGLRADRSNMPRSHHSEQDQNGPESYLQASGPGLQQFLFKPPLPPLRRSRSLQLVVCMAGEVPWLGLLGCLHVSGDLIRSHGIRLVEDVSPVYWRETYLKL